MATARRKVHTKKQFVSAGLGHSAAVLETGDLVTWGTSRQLQLGHDMIKEKERRNGTSEDDLGLPVDRHYPNEVPAIKVAGEFIATAAAGSSHTLAVTVSGHVYSWGSGAFGKLGHNNDLDVRIPKQVEFKRKRIARVACGPDHSAAISEQGEVLTWGAGSYGNLGHGDNTDIAAPKLVEALLSKKCISVACGSKHTLALTAAGGVYSWGYGGGGRLGCGDTRGLFRPKLVELLKDQPCLLIAAGESHSMAVTAERGQCYTWGVGDYGKLGHGDTTPQPLPRHLEYFRQHTLTWVSGGTFHSAGCSHQGILYTWGGGTYGKLGQMATINSLTPRPVKSVTDAHFVQVACGTFHTLALTNSGDMYSFGFNGNGRLGLADKSGSGMDTKQRTTPELIKSYASRGAKDTEDIGLPVDDSQAATTALVKALRPKKISHLCLGAFYSAALSDQGDVYTWGDGRHGVTGLDLSRQEEKEVVKPRRVLGLGGARNSVVMLAAGVRHLIAVTAEGLCYSWGEGSSGRLGHGDQTMVSEPRVISTLKQVVVTSAAAGEEHSAATTSEGLLYTWGSGSFGKLGHGEPSDESTPRRVQLDAKHVKAVACGYAHSVALCETYDVLVWGSGFKGKLGLSDDQNRLVPTPIASLKRKHIKSIVCGSFHTLVLTEQGDVYSWGIGERGQLGHGDLENRKSPTIINGGFGSSSEQASPIGCVAAGEAHSIASSADGTKVWSWGAGHYGQLGVGGLDPRLSPTPIMDLADQDIQQVACGANHSGAVSDVAGGRVFMWGNGSNSRLGNQLTDEQEVPQNVPTLSKETLTDTKSTGQGGEESSRLVTPDMMSRLHGTDIDAATAQRVLDDESQLAMRAKQADDAQSRQESMTGGDGLKEELANTDKDDASTVSTVMAVAMAGRAIKPSLDVLQQLVKSQRENVAEVIEETQRQISSIKEKLDDDVRRNEELEADCLDVESKVKLVLSNHKMVHEHFTKHYGYVRIQMMPGMSGSQFENEKYQEMISILYEEPQYLSVMLKKAEQDELQQKKAEADETNKLVAVICDRIYSNHYKARDEYYILNLIMHATSEDMTNITEPTSILASVNYATKLMAAYTRRGPNTEALKEALFKPLSLVLARKKLDLEIDPARVYKVAYDELKFKLESTDTKLPETVPQLQAWGYKEVKEIIEPRVKTLLELVELFLTRIIAARNMLPYGIRALAKKVYEMAQDRFPKFEWPAKMAGVANFIFTTYLCPAIIQPEAFDLCSASSRPTPEMKKNLLRIATTLKAIGSLKQFDLTKEPWFAEIAAKVKVSEELMKQFYSNLCDVPELEDQRRVTMYMESTESRTPTRAFELNALYLVHAVLYRHHAEIVSSSDAPLTTILRDLGNCPDQVSSDKNKHVLLRLWLRTREQLLTSANGSSGGSAQVDQQAALRQKLLNCLRLAPPVKGLRHSEGLKESMEELLQECKAGSNYTAAAAVKDVLDELDAPGLAISAMTGGDDFLQTTAEEISKLARRRVQLVKERKDLEKIVDFVSTHHEALKRKNASYKEYLEAVREQRITVRNVYTNAKMQKASASKRKAKEEAASTTEDRMKAEADRVKTVMSESPQFARIIAENASLSKYLEARPNFTKQQMRDLLDRRPDFVDAFKNHPEELIKIGRAPALRLMLDQYKEVKAALDKKPDVRRILESKPDLTRQQLNELVHTNAQLKDLYDSRPELKDLLNQRAKLFEDEQKALEDQKADVFVAGPLVKVAAKYLAKEGVLVTISLPPKMVAKLTFEFSSVRPGEFMTLCQHNGRSVDSFTLKLEDLLDMQARNDFVLDKGKLKLDVAKTLHFLNEKMRF